MAPDVPTWVLADPHGGQHPPADDALVALLDAAVRRRADLLILGDLFSAWLGYDRFWTPFQREVVLRLEVLRAAGGRVRFVVGNRDYLVKEALLGRAFDRVLDEEAVVSVGGVDTYVAHGDLLNAADRPYRLWRRISRSAPASAVLRRLPGPVGQRLVARTERGLSGTNRRHKTGTLPLAGLEALGRRAARNGAARALVGHFHHDRRVDVEGGVPVVVAPGWCAHQRILVGPELVSTPASTLL